MSFTQAVRTCFAKYATFAGRAARPEYWYWVLFGIIADVVLTVLDMVLFALHIVLPANLEQSVLILATLLPTLEVTCRRLHDVDRRGWWMLIIFAPIFGGYVLIVWACTPGTPGPNRFGPAPA